MTLLTIIIALFEALLSWRIYKNMIAIYKKYASITVFSNKITSRLLNSIL